MTPQQIPSLGRIVHYVSFGNTTGETTPGTHLAAIITAVHNDLLVDLAVFRSTGILFPQKIPFDASGRSSGSWHWPEFVAPIESVPINTEQPR